MTALSAVAIIEMVDTSTQCFCLSHNQLGHSWYLIWVNVNVFGHVLVNQAGQSSPYNSLITEVYAFGQIVCYQCNSIPYQSAPSHPYCISTLVLNNISETYTWSKPVFRPRYNRLDGWFSVDDLVNDIGLHEMKGMREKNWSIL